MSEQQKEERLLNPAYCILIFCTLACQTGYSMANSLMTSYLQNFGVSTAMLGVIPGLMSIVALVAQPVMGRVADLCNRRNLQTIGFGLISVAFLGYAFSGNEAMLVIARTLHGIGFALTSTAGLALVADILPKSKMALGLSYYGICSTAAGAFAPGFGLSIANAYGFRMMFLVATGLTILACVMSLFVRYCYQKPERTEKRRLEISDVIAPEPLAPACVGMCNAFACGTLSSFMLLHAQQRGVSNPSLYFTFFSLSLFLFRLFFSKPLGQIKPVIVVAIADLFLLLALVWASFSANSFDMIGTGILFGVGYGGMQPIIQTLCMQSVSASRRGAASSTYYMGLNIGQGLSPMITGYIGSLAGGDYAPAFLAMCVPVLCGLVVMLRYAQTAKNVR